MTEGQDEILRIASMTGFSEGAVRAMVEALRAGGGTMAQFDHPELGGFGQWSSGGMLIWRTWLRLRSMKAACRCAKTRARAKEWGWVRSRAKAWAEWALVSAVVAGGRTSLASRPPAGPRTACAMPSFPARAGSRSIRAPACGSMTRVIIRSVAYPSSRAARPACALPASSGRLPPRICRS